MTFDLGSYMLGVVVALSLVALVIYLIWRVDKKADDEILAEYRKARGLDE